MREEGGIIRIDLAMVMRPGVGDGEVHQPERIKDGQFATRRRLQARGRGVGRFGFSLADLDGFNHGLRVHTLLRGGEDGIGVCGQRLPQRPGGLGNGRI